MYTRVKRTITGGTKAEEPIDHRQSTRRYISNKVNRESLSKEQGHVDVLKRERESTITRGNTFTDQRRLTRRKRDRDELGPSQTCNFGENLPEAFEGNDCPNIPVL